MSLSDGGTGALATQTQAGITFTVSWPGTLPKPALDGDTATYSEVLPGVDLKVTATTTGVRQQVVVKDRTAAPTPRWPRWTSRSRSPAARWRPPPTAR
ncbi:hypothetical protein ACFQ9X_08825 [Catenulispora yoronensis]